MTAEPLHFDPAQGDSRAFRDALGRFGTGVTVVTCPTATGPIGITANSFASVSLDPPLVLWSPAKNSARYPFFAAAPHFAIHVLGIDQADMCKGFARTADCFDTLDWSEGAHRVPLIEGCLSRFECTKVAEHDGGDHTIIVARVTRVSTRAGKPLLFHSGRYGTLSDPS
ncbi:MAG: flavin reductase family protein [Roseivivax sp.]|nr:flavin reductase family protein [Roseivivax sp.]